MNNSTILEILQKGCAQTCRMVMVRVNNGLNQLTSIVWCDVITGDWLTVHWFVVENDFKNTVLGTKQQFYDCHLSIVLFLFSYPGRSLDLALRSNSLGHYCNCYIHQLILPKFSLQESIFIATLNIFHCSQKQQQ